MPHISNWLKKLFRKKDDKPAPVFKKQRNLSARAYERQQPLLQKKPIEEEDV